jgi:hypothetical protein
MATHLSVHTHDAMTILDIPSRFDVTYWPRNVEKYLEQTEKPLHRAILKNYLRHLLLEISGYWDQIVVPELTIDEPEYRVGDHGTVEVLHGKAAVEDFYLQTYEFRINVMGARTMNMCRGLWRYHGGLLGARRAGAVPPRSRS